MLVVEDSTKHNPLSVIPDSLVHAGMRLAGVEPVGNHGLAGTALIDPCRDCALLVQPKPVVPAARNSISLPEMWVVCAYGGYRPRTLR